MRRGDVDSSIRMYLDLEADVSGDDADGDEEDDEDDDAFVVNPVDTDGMLYESFKFTILLILKTRWPGRRLFFPSSALRR